MGNGEQVIITSEPWGRVQTDFDFGPQGKATGTHILTIDGNFTRVVWGFNTDLGMNPVNRYFGLMFDKMIGADYERGLAGLKTLVESMPKADFSTLSIESAEAAPQTILYTPLTTPCDDEAVAEGLAEVVRRHRCVHQGQRPCCGIGADFDSGQGGRAGL